MSSKYDRVKVRVHLGGEHYYTLSRFTLSKMLTFCKLPVTVAVKVSLDLKKLLVDQEKLEISQAELEAATFLMMAQYGYGEAHAKLFPVITRFYVERVPLVILIAGSGYCGKTAIAHSLGSKLNTHNVVSTELLLEIASSIYNGFSTSSLSTGCHVTGQAFWPQPEEKSLWLRETETEEDFVSTWCAWSEAIFPLVEEELNKAVTEGKVLILEGSLLNLAAHRPYLLREFQRRHGAIVVAFYVTSDDASCRFFVERFLSSCYAFLPSPYRSDGAAAVAWMMQRLKAVAEVQNQWFADRGSGSGGGGMERCWICGERSGNSQLAQTSACDGKEMCVRGAEASLSPPPSATSSSAVEFPEGAEEAVHVHFVNCSVERPLETSDVMQELVLERIMLELRQRKSLL
ncbi:ATP/GTP nucleotide-binding protein [Trypanosoma cruzi]|nr:putative Zeta toxin [Trypanosoma cruzi]RNF24749.1 ATP/GTP nucleotide-binding protein [Trypanosoma cruzi]